MGLFNTRVTRLRPSWGTDEDGSLVPDWTAPGTLGAAARVQQITWSEDTADRDRQTARFMVWLPPGTDITGGDRLAWQGRTLEVDGPPAAVHGLRDPHHTEVRAHEVIG